MLRDTQLPCQPRFFKFQTLQDKIRQLSDNESQVRAQLRDAKDHADLLEFRLLEVEELAKKDKLAKETEEVQS